MRNEGLRTQNGQGPLNRIQGVQIIIRTRAPPKVLELERTGSILYRSQH